MLIFINNFIIPGCELFMRLGIVCNKISIDSIVKLIEYSNVKNIQIQNYQYDIFEDLEQILDIAQKKEDALLFGGKAVYDFAMGITAPVIPWKYIDKKETSYLKAFVDALIRGYDISKISIDSCDDDRYEMLNSIYWITGIKNIHICNVESEIFDLEFLSKQYVWKIFDNHKKKYESKEVTCCFTCYDSVFYMLKENKVPVIRIDFTVNDIMDKVIRLKNMYEDLHNNTNEMAVIVMEFDLCEKAYNRIDTNAVNLQKLSIMKEIYNFADNLQGIVNVSENISGAMIVTTKKMLDMETDNLTRFRFIEKARRESMLTLSIGIGLGANPKICHENALTAKELAKNFGGDCTYLVFDKTVIGPIFERRDIFQEKEDIQEKVSSISEETQLTNDQIFKLLKLKEQYSLDVFTSKELADLYGCSLRCINKLISKLEVAGYVKVIGKANSENHKGRPYRLIKIKM